MFTGRIRFAELLAANQPLGCRVERRESATYSFKTKGYQIKFINKHVNDSDRVVFGNVVIKTLRQQRDLTSFFTLDVPLHLHASIYEFTLISTHDPFKPCTCLV